MLAPDPTTSLSAEEIIAALERRIERLTALASDQALFRLGQDATETGLEVVKLQNLLHQFRCWIEARALSRPKRAAQVFNFRRRKVAQSGASSISPKPIAMQPTEEALPEGRGAR